MVWKWGGPTSIFQILKAKKTLCKKNFFILESLVLLQTLASWIKIRESFKFVKYLDFMTLAMSFIVISSNISRFYGGKVLTYINKWGVGTQNIMVHLFQKWGIQVTSSPPALPISSAKTPKVPTNLSNKWQVCIFAAEASATNASFRFPLFQLSNTAL